MSDYLQLKSLRKLLKGEKVERAAAALPQTATGTLFNVVGGRIAVLQILGQVTTEIQDQANNTRLVATPTGGAPSNLCANLNIADDAIGTMYGVTGTVLDALQDDLGVMPEQAVPFIVKEGAIRLVCAAGNTGEVAWTLFYVPIDDGAHVTAA